MSKPAAVILVVASLVMLGLAFVAVFGQPSSRHAELARVGTLEGWIGHTARPGFRLLDQAESEAYFVAVYLTPAREIAVCYRWRLETDAPDTSVAVRGDDGENVQDPERWDDTTPLNPTGSVSMADYLHGMVVPLREDVRGRIEIVLKDNFRKPDDIPGRIVYTQTLDLGE